MTKYALLYERLNIETHKPETVVAHYADDAVLTAERHETIAAPRQDAEQAMLAQGWQYFKTAGPQSILMQHA